MKKDITKFSGLFTHPNPLSQVPEGSLSIADNCSIDREGIIENRRGFNFYGSITFSSAIKQLLEYKDRAIVHEGSTLHYDSDGAGNFLAYSGTIAQPDASTKIKGQEQNGSLYFTSSNGIQKIDALANNPARAGISQALDTQLAFDNSAASGFMPYNSRIAYRITWGKKDANNIFVQGAPSSRAQIANLPVEISSLTRSGSTATAVTVGPHGFSTGNIVDIENAEAFVTLSSLTQTAGIATGTVGVAADNPQAGDIVTIRGAAQPEYNGSFTVISNPGATTFTYAIDGNPVSPATGVIQAGTFTDNYNGSYVITVASSTSFTYTINDTPISTATPIENTTIIAGKYKDVELTFPVPSDITTSHFYRIYRSDPTDTPDIEPSDRMFLVAENPYVSGYSITVSDITPLDLEGEELYTNANIEGILQSNYRPPLAKDIALYKTFMFYSNTSREQFIDLQLLSVDGLTKDIDKITIGAEDYTFSSAENVGAKKFRLFADQTGSSLSRSGSVATITTAQDHGLNPGDRIFINDSDDAGYNDVYTVVTTPTSTTFTINVDSALSASATVTVSTGTPSQNIADTARAFTTLVNKASTNYYAFYTSGSDDVPGLITIQARTLTLGSFTTTGTSPVQAIFTPALPKASSNDAVPNRIYFAKYGQPDSVPILNYFDVGPREKAILRIIALRDSLFIIKEEGIYRLAGDDDRSFTITLFDSDIRCQALETAAKLNNTIFMFTDQGVVSIGDSGVAIISRPIEKTILPILTFPNFNTLMHGVAYESDRKYIMYTQDESTDVTATVAYVFNYMTNAWTKWEKPSTAAIVISDNLYLGNTFTNTVLKERKSRTREDKKDESVSALITDYNINIATIDYTYGTFVLEEGMLVTQGSEKAKILSIAGSNVCTLDRNASFTTGACTISRPIRMQFEFTAETSDVGAGILKQYREVQMYPESDSFTKAQMYFASDLSNISMGVDFDYPARELGWGFFPWGGEPWGNSGTILGTTPLRTFVPKGVQRCRALTVGLVHDVANENLSILNTSITYNSNKERTTK